MRHSHGECQWVFEPGHIDGCPDWWCSTDLVPFCFLNQSSPFMMNVLVLWGACEADGSEMFVCQQRVCACRISKWDICSLSLSLPALSLFLFNHWTRGYGAGTNQDSGWDNHDSVATSSGTKEKGIRARHTYDHKYFTLSVFLEIKS